MPSRFVYHERIRHSLFPFAFKGIGRLLFGTADVIPGQDRIDRFEQYLMESDDKADAVVTDLFGKGRPHARSFRILQQSFNCPPGKLSADIPELLRKLIEESYTDPTWLDRNKLERGAATCRRLGLDAMGVLGDLALCGGYANPDISRPLTITGQLKGDRTFDRLGETSQFWYDVTRKGAMEKGAKGFQSALRVRLMHAIVRQRILKRGNWDSLSWGLPINRSDSLATNVAFSMAMLYGVRMLGIHVTRSEVSDVLHLWKYIGYIMGDDAEWLPDTAEEGLQCLLLIYLSNKNKPDSESIQLAQDYLDSFRPAKLPGYREMSLKDKALRHFLYWRHKANAEYLIPPPLYRQLDLPSSMGSWIILPLLRVPLNIAEGWASLIIPGSDKKREKRGADLQAFVIEMMMGERQADYVPK